MARDTANPDDAPLPEHEQERLALLGQCRILDSATEPDFDDLTRLAAQICGTPIALISLVDGTRQWFKSRVGIEVTETPRRLAFCAHTILETDRILVVPDATKDARFAANELVTGEMGIRFYAGAPLVVEDGHALGSLCVIDRQPRKLSAAQLEALATLARQVVSLIELRRRNFALREAQDARVALSELQRGILDSAAHAVIAGSPEGIITEFNPAAQRMLGYSAEEMIGRLTPAVFHDPAEVVARAKEFSAELGVPIEPGFEVFVAKARRRLPNEHEWTYIRKDGSRFPVQLSVTALWDGPEKIIGFLGLAIDITERKQAEARLIESERRFREAIEYSAIGMALVGLDGAWLKVNRAICAIVGRSEEDLLHQTFQDITHPDDLDADLSNVRALLAGEIDHYQMEKRYIHERGHFVRALLAVTLVRDTSGAPAYFVSQIEDITERHEAEQRLQASLLEKETLLQEVHHRVKNNLQVISSLLSLQASSIQEPAMAAKFQECQGRIRSMALLHEKLYQSETLARVDLKDYLEGLARIIFAANVVGAGVKLDLALERFSTDMNTAVPLGLLVNELLTNAAKYAFRGRDGGRVRLALVRGVAREFTLTVEDDGVGLPQGFEIARAKTLGMRLVGMFAKQLEAELKIRSEPGQTSFRIRCAGALDDPA